MKDLSVNYIYIYIYIIYNIYIYILTCCSVAQSSYLGGSDKRVIESGADNKVDLNTTAVSQRYLLFGVRAFGYRFSTHFRLILGSGS